MEENNQITPESLQNSAPKQKSNIRGNKNLRLGMIVLLMAIVAVIFLLFEKARVAMVILFLMLMAAFGMEVSNNDWDLQQLIKTKSFEESKVGRDAEGNVLFDILGNQTTDATKGKKADEYNCADFTSQPSAQNFYEKVGGIGNDVNRLDGDKDGEACEALPKN
jgi:diacylglycerol kinase